MSRRSARRRRPAGREPRLRHSRRLGTGRGASAAAGERHGKNRTAACCERPFHRPVGETCRARRCGRTCCWKRRLRRRRIAASRRSRPGELFCAAGADGVTLRCPLQVTLASTARHALKAVCGGTTEPEPEDARRPGVILRRTEQPEQVWDIAKACRTAPETVTAANDLQADEVPAGTLLLIPM